MDMNYIVRFFLGALKGVLNHLVIMCYWPGLKLYRYFFSLGADLQGSRCEVFSLVYLAFIRATPPIL